MKLVAILREPSYSTSVWCKELYKSLKERLKQKRIPFCDAYDKIKKEYDGVFLIASDYNWINNTVKKLNGAGIKPILICNQAENVPGCDYSCVCSDIMGSMKYLLDELKASGKTRVALYGVNTESVSDIGRVDGLFTFKDESFSKMRIFANFGSLKKCFSEFLKEYKDFDAVICSNDFAAISLVENLKISAPEALFDLKILSCAKTRLSSFYKGTITSVDMNFEQYGKAAVFIYERLNSHPYISGMTVSVKWNAENKKPPRQEEVALNDKSSTSSFYTDSELKEMLDLEKILNIISETDKKIISSLISGYTIDQTAERTNLTTGGVKYRIKRILTESGIKDKTEMLSLIKKYSVF